MYEELKKIIDESKNIVFFGGAGVSTESGVPDFRSEKGLYNAMQQYSRSPEEMLSKTFFDRHTDIFFDYYKNNLIYKQAKPNNAHLALAKLEDQGKLSAIVTQNIDGLHQAAGSRKVCELHGSVHRNYCVSCGEKYDLDDILSCEGVPKCHCGGTVRPDVVLYEEALDQVILSQSIDAISSCDTLVIGGTSLVVYPAAGLVNYFRGKHLILINKSRTDYDNRTNLVINGAIGQVLGEVIFEN